MPSRISPLHLSCLLGPALVLALGVTLWTFTVDDAYIVARYAQHLAQGAGYAMNPGQRSDGVTGPLWLVPFVLAELTGVDPLCSAKIVGLCAGMLACWSVCWQLRGAQGGPSLALAAGCVLGLSPDTATWSVAGLGSGAAMLCTAGALRETLRGGVPSGARLGVYVGLLAWLRPECAPLAGVLLIACGLRCPRQGQRAWGVAGLFVCAVLLFRYALFGHALPLSLYAKGGSTWEGALYSLRALAWTTGGVGVLLAMWSAWRGHFRERVLFVGCAVHVLAVSLAGGDWMPGFRLMLPALPLYAMLLARGQLRLALHRPWLSRALLLLALVAPLTDLALRVPRIRESAAGREGATAELARWLREHAQVVALVDVGFLGYASGVEVVDLGAVTDEELARLPGGHLQKRVTSALLKRRHVDTLVLHASAPPRVDAAGRLRTLAGYPVERRVAAMPWVQREFRVASIVEHAPHYHYVVLTRSP